MRRRTIAPLAALALAGVLAGASPAGAVTRTFTVVMTGGEETPVGDLDGSGVARFTINTDTNRICYVIRVSGIAPSFAAHIHVAPRGEPGPVVVPLASPTRGRASGCVTDADADAIASDPANYYVNVHNQPFPGGALRAQLA
ncbi:MAG TPA: CHRD domain-containing protein [Acidimicrobiales bacterium]|nr:CHRD domain-containing protein [Acidimicrobiales bacterium]